MNRILKSFDLKLDAEALAKLAKTGELSVVFATMGLWDKDGDWAEPGFYGKQDVVMVPAHDWNHVPIGKGTTREVGNLAVADIKMNLDIQAAKDWRSAIMFDLANGRPVQEYSYGFKILDGGAVEGERAGRKGRILQPREDGTPGSKIWEVSPVMVGAGEGTHTLTAKGMKFLDEADAVLAAADALVVRGKSLADLRAKDGRDMSAANKERLAALADSLVKAAQAMTELVAPKGEPAKAMSPELTDEIARMLKLRARL